MNGRAQRVVRGIRLGGLAVVLAVALLAPRGAGAATNSCTDAKLKSYENSEWNCGVSACNWGVDGHCIDCFMTDEAGRRYEWHDFCPLPDGTQPPTTPPPSVEGGTCVGGSIIDVDNRTVGEAVPIAGTPFDLTYFSDRVPGHVSSYRLDIPMAASDPADVSEVRATIFVAGRTIAQSGSGASGDVYHFVWDGLDASGHWTPGGVKASVTVAETHPSGATDYPLVWSPPVGTRNVLVDGLGGWTLSAHHFFLRWREPAAAPGLRALADGAPRPAGPGASGVSRLAGRCRRRRRSVSV